MQNSKHNDSFNLGPTQTYQIYLFQYESMRINSFNNGERLAQTLS